MITERQITARHEAGHAVASIALGWSLRYATLRPKDGFAGTTWIVPPRKFSLIDDGAIALSGMVAESALMDNRRFLLSGALDDMRRARDTARRAIRLREHRGADIDASWSEWQVGARMWHQARDLMAEYREAVDYVAAELHRSRRAVSGRWIRDAVANASRCDEPPTPDEWWPPRYSRLKWLDAPR